MKKMRPKPGTVVEIGLPNGKYAYGRVYDEAGIGIYRKVSEVAGQPPIGSRDFQFIVGVYDDVLTSGQCRVVGQDPFGEDEDPWPPPRAIIDPISGKCSIYHHGKIRPAVTEECQNMEITAVWDLHHIIDRILNGNNSIYLKSMSLGMAEPKKSTVQ